MLGGLVAVLVCVIAFLYFWFSKLPVCPKGTLKPKIEEVLQQEGEVQYDLSCLDTPVVTGSYFKLLIYLSYTRFGRYLILPYILGKSNMFRMSRVQIPERPTYIPIPEGCGPQDHSNSNRKTLKEVMEKEIKKASTSDFRFPTVADYVRAYRSQRTNPVRVAEIILAAIADSDEATPPLRAVVQYDRDTVLAMAKASEKRWKEGKTLSYLDGVPVSVKEEYRCDPYEFRSGATYVSGLCHGVPEAECVRKLKAAGAVVIGVTNMHEYGTGTLGSNPHPSHLTGRNPYDPRRYAGGSSTGAAISIAAGFCPISIGGDGGGSIRVPASLCGTVGLKPTAGLVDTTGLMPKVFTVGVTGPLSSSVLDTALAMDIITAKGNQKLVDLSGLGQLQLNGLKVGVYNEYFNHTDEEIKILCRAALSNLKDMGAELVDVIIPELEDTRVAHVITIGSEFASSLALDLDQHYDDLNRETHLLVGTSTNFTSIDYVNSQKQRTRAMAVMQSLFDKVDIIATPGVGCLPPIIRREALECGISDGASSSKIMRFSFLGNLTGIPGLVVPVGYTDSGLPVNLQLMSSWYREDIILKAGYVMEHSGRFPARRPQVFYDVLH